MSFSRLLAAGKSMVGMQNSQSPYRMRPENRLPKFESKKNPFAAKAEAPKTEPIPTAMPATAIAAAQPGPIFEGQLDLISTIPISATKPAEPELVTITVAPAISVTVPEESDEMTETVFEQRRIMRPEPKGLVDASPLGLKTGTPTRAPLPAPVVAPPKNPAKKPQAAAPGEPPAKAPENGSSCVAVSKPAKSKFAWLASLFKIFKFAKRTPKTIARAPVQTELSLDRIRVMRNDLNDADLEVVSIKRSEKAEAPPVRLQPLAETEAGSLGRIATRIFGASESLVR